MVRSAYNAQAAVDAGAQIIVAQELTQSAAIRAVVPLDRAIETNLGRKRSRLSGLRLRSKPISKARSTVSMLCRARTRQDRTAANGKIGGPLTNECEKNRRRRFETPTD